MVLVDTCGRIEWLPDGVLAKKYVLYFNQVESFLVPTSVQFELYKWILQKNGIQPALETIASTEQAKVIPLTTTISLFAADLSVAHKLSFADAIIYAMAQFHQAELITPDDYFKGLSGVIYFEK